MLSQEVYLSTSNNQIFELGLDYSVTPLVTIQGLTASIEDIAINPSGELYAIHLNEIIRLDIATGSFELLATLPDEDGNQYTNLVCNSQNQLFSINNSNENLYRYDIDTGIVDLITHIDFFTPGDLTFYRGHLIFPSLDVMKAYNFETDTVIDIFCIPDSNINIWGTINLFDDCISDRILTINFTEDLVEFDIESGEATTIDYDNSLLIDLSVFGATSSNEYLASNCTETVTAVNCTLSLADIHQKRALFYPNPASEILYINPQVQLSQLEIYTLSGKNVLSVSKPERSIEVSTIKDGTYILSIRRDAEVFTSKLIVKK